jgi:ferredoxin-NADP reductase/ferredoxin
MRVRLEPVGIELDCGAGETVLDAAFRQGLNLVHGCREGQCSACKCFLLEGDAAHKRHSSFALSDAERASGYALMCRAQPETDLVVELLHFDPDALALEHPIADGEATVTAIDWLTENLARVALDAPGFAFTPGQYVDLHVPTGSPPGRRSFSMANVPDGRTIELLIRRYPGGRLSGMLGGQISAGTTLAYTGPYGSLRLHDGAGPILLIAGGSGLAPILSLLRQLAAERSDRPVHLCFGASAPFCLEEIERAGAGLARFELTVGSGRSLPATVEGLLVGGAPADVYMAGPPALLDALERVVDRPGLDRVYVDRFTASTDAPVARTDERAFAWYEPRGRRATIYEDVTVDTQPSPQRHLTRDWLVSFAGGRGTWDERSTALRCGDWFAFRDPGERWEQPFYREESGIERGLAATMEAAAGAGLLADLDADWLELLGTHVQATAFVEHGLWLATATIARDCLSDTVAHCVCLEAAIKQRSAQSLVLHAMDLEGHLEIELPIAAARETFLTAPEWQPARRYLERLAATPDWAEVILAANLVFEPLVGTFLRRELLTRAAAAGDPVTPSLASAQLREWEWTRAWSVALSRHLIADPEHGAANRATLLSWAGGWVPDALAALAALGPLLERAPRAGIGLDGALGRTQASAAGVMTDAGLGEALGVLGAGAETRVRRREARTPIAEVAARMPPPPSNGPSGAPDYVGIVISRSAEGDAIAHALAERNDVELLEQAAFWEIRAVGRLVIPYAELTQRLGYELDAYSIQHELSTHYGRMVAGDEALMLFADPTEAMTHLLA